MITAYSPGSPMRVMSSDTYSATTPVWRRFTSSMNAGGKDHSLRVGIAQRLSYLPGNPHRLAYRQLPLSVHPIAQRFAGDERHGIPEALVGPTGVGRDGAAVEHRQDERVLQPGGDFDLPEEPLGAEQVCQLGPEDLQGDEAVVFEVAGEIDRGHAAAAELALDRVAIAKGVRQRGGRCGHAAPCESNGSNLRPRRTGG